MRAKINIISWGVFLVLLTHMSEHKPARKVELSRIKMDKVQKVTLKKEIRTRKGLSSRLSSEG